MNHRKILCLIVLLVVSMSISFARQRQQQDEWVSLFDGKTLNGWSIHSGFAKYQVEDGAIVGTTVKASPNSFLCTDREYGDFILEFEVILDPKLNSGVQIRSKIAKAEKAFVFSGRDGKPQKRIAFTATRWKSPPRSQVPPAVFTTRPAGLSCLLPQGPILPPARLSKMDSGTSSASSVKATV